MKEEIGEILRDIYRIFDTARKNTKLSKRYIRLAKKIAMRHNVKMPKELRKKYCRKLKPLKTAILPPPPAGSALSATSATSATSPSDK